MILTGALFAKRVKFAAIGMQAFVFAIGKDLFKFFYAVYLPGPNLG
jgi:hypothetical protein